MKKRNSILAIFLACLTAFAMMPLTAGSAYAEGNVIDRITVTVTPPSAGTASTNAKSAVTINAPGISKYFASWQDHTGYSTQEPETLDFVEGENYYAVITLHADSGYVFKKGESHSLDVHACDYEYAGECIVSNGELYYKGIQSRFETLRIWIRINAVAPEPGTTDPANTGNKEKSSSEPPVVKTGGEYSYGGQQYVVTALASGNTGGEVAFKAAKNAKKVTVPASIKLADGKTYNVTSVNTKAFKGTKIRTVTIGKNVKKIKKNAFKGSKATKMIVKTKKLTKKTSVKGSLKGSKIKTVQVKVGKKSVNKKYVKKYKKVFTKKNAGKKANVK